MTVLCDPSLAVVDGVLGVHLTEHRQESFVRFWIFN